MRMDVAAACDMNELRNVMGTTIAARSATSRASRMCVSALIGCSRSAQRLRARYITRYTHTLRPWQGTRLRVRLGTSVAVVGR